MKDILLEETSTFEFCHVRTFTVGGPADIKHPLMSTAVRSDASAESAVGLDSYFAAPLGPEKLLWHVLFTLERNTFQVPVKLFQQNGKSVIS